jgi:AAA family ATP:ADP antiporter
MSQKTPGFSKIRAFFWPIYKHELIKFVPMMALFFFISFNYHLLRIAKDALIVTAPKAGAEAIPFLKVWAVLPSAIFLTFLFTRFSNKLNREKVFYAMISMFLVFFIVFACFLYPYQEKLFLNKFADYLQGVLPKGLNGFISIIRYWTYSLFYIMSEGWSTIILTMLLWGFANDVVKMSEAKRFYALFGIGVNSAGIFAGQFGSYISSRMQQGNITINPIVKFLGGKNAWDQTVLTLVGIIIIFTIISIILYRLLHKYFFKERASFAGVSINTKKPKYKMSLTNTFQYLFKSKYVLCIALIVLSYNIVINFTEVLWKSEMKALFPSPGEYTAYMSKITFFIGIIATLGSYLVSGSYIRAFGWKSTALLTPFIFIITGIGFFYFLFLKQYSSTAVTFFGLTPLALCVFFGSLQNILSRAAKYTVFDSSKEIAFIPLSDENKIKGKAAIDGIGSRLGKSGSSLVLQTLLLTFASPIACSPIIAVILIIVMPMWMFSIGSLNKKFLVLTKTQEEEETPEESTVIQET